MGDKYTPGGVVSGTGGMDWGGTDCNVAANSMGTNRGNPNTKEKTPPGGHGSTGSRSTSKAK